MIQKIKDLMQTKELIDDITKNVKDNSSCVKDLKEELNDLNKSLKEIRDNQKEFLESFKDNLDVIDESKESLKKEVYDFRLLKAQMQKNILSKFEDELDSQLKVYSEKLKNDIDEYNKLKEQAGSILSEIKKVSNEVNKFTEISKNIKKEDFELEKFGTQLLEMDKEKLELMRKIDTLERLISKMRRSQR
ncbi:MAG: hypothetical protein U9O94_01740 [Nanoarchaeota archaeon]|nr:hypothetical protein [Nanoarchaeota archaeon]